MNDKYYIGKIVSKSKLKRANVNDIADWYQIETVEPFVGLVVKHEILKEGTKLIDNRWWDLIVEMDDDWRIRKIKRVISLTAAENDRIVKKFTPALEKEAGKALNKIIYKRPPSQSKLIAHTSKIVDDGGR